jgi:hypothetical protein
VYKQKTSLPQLQQYKTNDDIDSTKVNGNEDAYMEEALMRHNPASLSRGSSSAHVPPFLQKPLKNILEESSCKGKDRLAAAAQNTELKPDPRPANTAVKRRQSSAQTKMLEVTEAQGKEILDSMRKLYAVEDQKVTAASAIVEKQLAYFKFHDEQLAFNQCGLVNAVETLSAVIGRAYTSSRGVPTPSGRARAARMHGTVHATVLSDNVRSSDADEDINITDGTDGFPIGVEEQYYTSLARRPGTPFVVSRAGSGSGNSGSAAPNYDINIEKFDDVMDITKPNPSAENGNGVEINGNDVL